VNKEPERTATETQRARIPQQIRMPSNTTCEPAANPPPLAAQSGPQNTARPCTSKSTQNSNGGVSERTHSSTGSPARSVNRREQRRTGTNGLITECADQHRHCAKRKALRSDQRSLLLVHSLCEHRNVNVRAVEVALRAKIQHKTRKSALQHQQQRLAIS
jgi:hypothetical protein